MGETRGTNNFGREVSHKVAKYSIKLDYIELTICSLKLTYINTSKNATGMSYLKVNVHYFMKEENFSLTQLCTPV